MAEDTEGLAIDVRNAVALCASVDEVAIYDTALPDALIYQHYNDTIIQHTPYSPYVPVTPAPPPRPYPNSTNESYYNLKEFAPGTELPSPPGKNNTQGVMLTCLEQLQYVSGPRYNTTHLKLYDTPYNFNWMAPGYMAGQGIPAERPLLANVTLAIQEIMASKWRYGMVVGPRDGGEYAWLNNATFELANNNPQWPLHMIIERRFAKSQLFNQSLPDGCFMQNSKGQFITVLGDVVPTGGKKTLRAMSQTLANTVGCPDTLFSDPDGLFYRQLFLEFTSRLKRPIDIVNADGEIFISLMSPSEYFNYSADPKVLADYEQSNAPNWETFFSEWRLRLTNGWTNTFMKYPQLEDSVLKDAAFTMYQVCSHAISVCSDDPGKVQGDNPFFGNWTVTRQIFTPMHDAHTKSLTYYSTLDFYLQHPHEHWSGAGPDHGIQCLACHMLGPYP